MCGNGIVDTAVGEQCDDGGVVSGDGCGALCQLESGNLCGNGTQDGAEVCDDGNTISGDGCSSDCQSDETCGNGRVDLGEQCDDGNLVNGDTCSSSCQLLTCPLFIEEFANNSAGWTLGTEWQIGSAMASTGQSVGHADPATDQSLSANNGVAGVVIGGNASTAQHDYYFLTSPPINTGFTSELYLSYWRWLNSDHEPYMQNIVQVYDGSSWVTLFESAGPPAVRDNAWTPHTFDLTSYRNAALRVRFGHRVQAVGAFSVSSWNIDDFKILTVCP